jgi:hypothetical protein
LASTHPPLLVHGESGVHPPLAAQSGAVPAERTAHSPSVRHPRQAFASQIGRVGTLHPPVASQSAQVEVARMQRSSVPEQPPVASQSTQACAVTLH